MTDEPDTSPDVPITGPDFAAYLNALRPTDEQVSYSVLVNPLPPYNCPATFAPYGITYLAINALVGGTEARICDPDWTAAFDEIADQFQPVVVSYSLSQIPIPSTLTVSVEEAYGTFITLVEFDPVAETGQWTYDAKENTVTLVDYVPQAGAMVYIDYEVE